MTGQRCLILALAAMTIKAVAADLTILAVGPFGQLMQGCHVDGIRTAGKEGGTRPQYDDRFQGLVGNIPSGEYEIRIVCGDSEAHKQITVDHANQFEVVAFSGRHLISDHVKPRLIVKLNSATLTNEIWWIRLVGLYSGKTYTERFGKGNGEAMIADPDPGSYLVTVTSTNAYACVREVDFVESTSAWTFHPASCSFEFDRFAHLVLNEDKLGQKQGGWYEEMQGDREKLRRAIKEALTKK